MNKIKLIPAVEKPFNPVNKLFQHSQYGIYICFQTNQSEEDVTVKFYNLLRLDNSELYYDCGVSYDVLKCAISQFFIPIEPGTKIEITVGE